MVTNWPLNCIGQIECLFCTWRGMLTVYVLCGQVRTRQHGILVSLRWSSLKMPNINKQQYVIQKSSKDLTLFSYLAFTDTHGFWANAKIMINPWFPCNYCHFWYLWKSFTADKNYVIIVYVVWKVNCLCVVWASPYMTSRHSSFTSPNAEY